MTDLTPDRPEHHRHAGAAPRSNPWKVVAIVLGSLIGLGLIIWLVVFLVGGGAPAPTPTPTPTPTATPTPTPTPTPTSTTAALCTTDNSTAELGTSSGAAGSVQVPIIFTNTSSAPCTLEGFPTVEFVGDDNGTQLGAPAADDTQSSPVALVTIEPGNSAASLLTITVADTDGCTRVPANGFRVIPPGSNDAFFLATTDYQACQEPNTVILIVTAVATN